ncbi:MAG: phosphatase PAP2 family protein [Acidobacteria bacterium]|nr:phosphatase PAP2 family protein [Acidobacteriota bacterium]
MRLVPCTVLLLLACAVPCRATDDQAARPFWKPLVEDHWRHVTLVVLTWAADEGIDQRIGPRQHPLLFGNPPIFDEEVRDHFRRGASDTRPHGFIESHASEVTGTIAAGAILASAGPRWRDDVTDFLGLWEARRFNIAMTGIVKNVLGRQRPELEFAAADGASPRQIRRLRGEDDNHRSFYSHHASSAFTTLSYADFVLSRRLELQPIARRWAHVGLYTLGAYIAWSRVLQDAHYLSDVAIGSVAGTLVGRSFYSFNHADGLDHRLSWDPITSRRFTLSPPVPIPGGVMVSARVGI